MNYLILYREAGSDMKIPRPFNRACSQTEAIEILQDWGKTVGEQVFLHANNIGQDKPFAYIGRGEFFLFVEPF